MLGLSLHGWENSMVVFLIIAGGFALLAGAATWAVVRLQRIEIAQSSDELDRYKVDAAKAVESAKADAARANESSERLRYETARLTADNFALQTVLLPRHVGVIGVNGPAMANTWFAGLEKFSGTPVAIQVVSGDREAQNLANEIAIAVDAYGWKPQLIDGKRSNSSSANIPEGVRVSYPVGKPWNPQEQEQPWFAWHSAAEALADALTRAGLSIGDRPVSRFGFSNNPPDATDMRFGLEKTYFSPPLEGVYVEVGSRPVEGTLQWIKMGRPDMLGNKPADAAPAAQTK
jgi:hypothetical protein